jgi:hypothetical protein
MHIAVLRRVRSDVASERQKHLERMASGVPGEEYHKLVGRAAEGKKIIEYIDDLERRINRGDDIDEEDGDGE